MKPKFKVGDKVRFNRRTPKSIQQELKRQRTRTIVDIGYDPDRQCTFYELGGRGSLRACYQFRSYMLAPVKRGQAKELGRPRLKRKWKPRTKQLYNSYTIHRVKFWGFTPQTGRLPQKRKEQGLEMNIKKFARSIKIPPKSIDKPYIQYYAIKL